LPPIGAEMSEVKLVRTRSAADLFHVCALACAIMKAPIVGTLMLTKPRTNVRLASHKWLNDYFLDHCERLGG
jgi:hypothetical protein